MLSEEKMAEVRAAFREDSHYLGHCSTQVRAVLTEIIDHPWFPGVTDPSALGLLGSLLRIIQPERMLQLGTHIGFSAIYFADILVRNARPGTLVTVEPDELAHEAARQWAVKAGVEPAIQFVDGRSVDEQVDSALRASGPFDLVYLDSSHSYAGTKDELALILRPGGWLGEHGILLLHDVTELLANLSPEFEGGVRRAVLEWLALHPSDYHHLLLEPPLWPNGCGLGAISRRTAHIERQNGDHSIRPHQLRQNGWRQNGRPQHGQTFGWLARLKHDMRRLVRTG